MSTMIPIDGMKEEPYGLPLMMDAWRGCVHWAIGRQEFRDSFKKDTGNDLEMLVGRSAIEKMIDESCGLDKEMMAQFCDWVTINLWGKEVDHENR